MNNDNNNKVENKIVDNESREENFILDFVEFNKTITFNLWINFDDVIFIRSLYLVNTITDLMFKSKIKEVGRNVILDMKYPELFKFKVDRSTPLPSDESIAELVDE